MKKLLMFGIDGLDSILLSQFIGDLPHFSRLLKESPRLSYRSVFPPDTPTAWASIYTGLNPAKHGVVYFVDPLERVSILSCKDVDNRAIKGKTFWDIAGERGKRVCVVLPELGFPVWGVNGAMVARSHDLYSDELPVQAYPASLAPASELAGLSYLKWMPQKKLILHFLETQQELINNELNFSLKMLKKEPWDLFFLYSPGLDWLGHNMWSYFDETDPSYPGPNPYQDLCREFYQLYDGIVGRFLDAADDDTSVIVFSDHGFGIRPQKLLNVNEILRRNGLLVSRIKRTNASDPYWALEWLKGKVTDFINRFGAGKIITKLLQVAPSAKKVFTAPRSIDWENTAAYVSDLSGIKSYYYGGIIIEPKHLGDRDYEEVRQRLIDEIGAVIEPESGEPVAKWVRRREELYSGDQIFRYPDIVFQLREEYGAGWALFEGLFSPCRTHNIQPGSHRIDSPVFLVSNAAGYEPVAGTMELMDVAPTVLNLLGIDDVPPGDGKPALQKKRGTP